MSPGNFSRGMSEKDAMKQAQREHDERKSKDYDDNRLETILIKREFGLDMAREDLETGVADIDGTEKRRAQIAINKRTVINRGNGKYDQFKVKDLDLDEKYNRGSEFDRLKARASGYVELGFAALGAVKEEAKNPGSIKKSTDSVIEKVKKTLSSFGTETTLNAEIDREKGELRTDKPKKGKGRGGTLSRAAGLNDKETTNKALRHVERALKIVGDEIKLLKGK